ncbi:MAG: DivIVA domain-containing protein [Candidatus Abyssobacteria bacterium SURF_17]|uniref:DivIVA domain-containing protein n=1 Tax=Candidatus Abyssobacteria bacterium SURF_17 TaxID=2093361 RepID=A0A419F1S2_9BACT|nr:MAG: DivIVA domain-containing protein [Candidatus Abyssubacteria bacterium SURF_17]
MTTNLTPNEILQKRFSQVFRGLNPDEVLDFLRLVASEFEELLRQNMILSDKVKQLEEAVEEYRHMETTLKNTLISSQKIGQEIKDEAERKSNLRIREAELEAERLIQRARQHKDRLEEETFQLLNQHKRFRAEFMTLIETHRKMVQTQDSRLLLDHNLKDASAGQPEPEIEQPDNEEAEKPQVGEEEIKDLEILFPEGKE